MVMYSRPVVAMDAAIYFYCQLPSGVSMPELKYPATNRASLRGSCPMSEVTTSIVALLSGNM